MVWRSDKREASRVGTIDESARTMDALTIMLIISILIYVVIGGYAGRSVKKIDDYFVAGRRAPTLLILGTLVASL